MNSERTGRFYGTGGSTLIRESSNDCLIESFLLRRSAVPSQHENNCLHDIILRGRVFCADPRKRYRSCTIASGGKPSESSDGTGGVSRDGAIGTKVRQRCERTGRVQASG